MDQGDRPEEAHNTFGHILSNMFRGTYSTYIACGRPQKGKRASGLGGHRAEQEFECGFHILPIDLLYLSA